MRRTLFALLASAALIAVAWAQANNSNTWQTPGNQTVGGVVQMCPRASDNVAVPCNNAGVTGGAGLPAGAIPVTGSANGTTAATNASLPAAAGKFTYICGFLITVNATAGISGFSTITGTVTASLNFVEPVLAAPAVGVVSQSFSPCIPSSAVNTAIVVNSIAAGAGGQNSVNVWGYQL